jgi:hypothetical protein
MEHGNTKIEFYRNLLKNVNLSQNQVFIITYKNFILVLTGQLVILMLNPLLKGRGEI